MRCDRMMMRANPSGLKFHFLGIAVCLLVLVPRLALAQTGDPDLQTLCQPLEIQQGDPQETPCLRHLANVAERKGDLLTLKLDNGKTKIFESNPAACKASPEGCVGYRLVGYIASDRQFVIQVTYHEFGFVNLVSRRTGEITRLADW